jgi:monovalent cation:H+ antiporter-2, CPA2 family
MPHDITLISTIAVGFALAFICGFLANRLGASPLVGYLVAGVAIGLFTPGFVADRALAGQLAEIGVMLLMFGVGLHFSVADLMAVRRVVLLKALEERNAITTVRGAAVIMNPVRPTAYRAVHKDLFGIDVYAVTDI